MRGISFSIRKLGLVLLALALLPRPGVATGSQERKTLKGIRTVFVMVEEIPAFPGLTTRLKTAVELRLRKAGITVQESDVPGVELAGVPFLHVLVNATGNDDHEPSSYAVAIRVGFNQIVFLPAFPMWQSLLHATANRASVRDGTSHHTGETWSSGSVGLLGAVRAEKKALESVEEMTDEFINDFLAVNPPARPVKD